MHIEGSRVMIYKKILYFFLWTNFVLTDSADPDEMPHYAAFHLGLHCLSKYSFMGFYITNG